MLINPFNGINAGISGNVSNSRAQAEKAVQQISSGNRITRAADNVADLSIAAGLQNQVSELRAVLTNTSLFSSLTQIAESGATQIQEIVSQLQSLASQASSGTLSDENRQALDIQFQALVAEADRIAGTTEFNDAQLLDGSLSGDNALDLNTILGAGGSDDGASLSIESLTAANLLGSDLSIATQEGAEQALAAIQQAANNVGTAIAGIGAFSEQVEFTSAYLETAISNQTAASSSLTDTDLVEASTALSQANLQQDIAIAVEAQTKRLPPSALELFNFNQT